ncbi:hypothetical protein, conserved [Leishmania lindenbergi]|uniref:Transmembrane protein 231 n=1 Tax=Leishmania lindenbergi TaxID=651832 RepID=A0AAW3A0A7_9TRYP
MAPPSNFLWFVLRRLRYAVLFSIALLVLLYAISSMYYVVRVSVIQNPTPFVQIERDTDGTTQPLMSQAVPMSEDTAASLSVAEGGEATLRGARHCNSNPPYTHMYKVLRPGTPMIKQCLRNPTLPADVPLCSNDAGHASAERCGGLCDAVPLRQRYVLDKLQLGMSYMIRLSFLGPPSVGFDLVLYQVRRSSVVRFVEDNNDVAGVPSPRVRGWTEEPQDTELLVFVTSRDNALEFSMEENVWVDRADIDSIASGSNFDATTMHGVIRAASDTNDPFVPVVEVQPRALSIPVDAYRLPLVCLNMELEQLGSFFLPPIAVPLAAYVVWALVFVGYLGIYTFVSSGIAGGEGAKQHLD